MGRRLYQSRNLASRIYKNFDNGSKERITRALSTGSLAADSLQNDIVLTSLWAGLEVLLGDPPEQEARISHFVRSLTPCVCIRYHRRSIVAVHDYLTVRYRSKLQVLIGKANFDTDSDHHTQMTKIICMNEHEAILKEIFELISDDPLATHRLFRLWKSYKSPRDKHKTISQHYQRVEWQINRIYRVRNSLVHAGRSPSYTDSLSLNTLEYLRTAIVNIARISSKHGGDANLDQAIAEVGFEWKNLLFSLENSGNPHFDERLAHQTFSAF